MDSRTSCRRRREVILSHLELTNEKCALQNQSTVLPLLHNSLQTSIMMLIFLLLLFTGIGGQSTNTFRGRLDSSVSWRCKGRSGGEKRRQWCGTHYHQQSTSQLAQWRCQGGSHQVPNPSVSFALCLLPVLKPSSA